MGHWYDTAGSPAYEQPNKSKPGTFRPTTLSDAKKLNLVPSVTTIFELLAKPGLDRWKTDQLFLAIESEYQRGLNEPLEQYKGRILAKSKEVSQKASERGTELHNKMEAIYTVGINKTDPDFITLDAATQEVQSIGDFHWVPEVSFHSQHGFGGKVDLHSRDGDGVVLDFKTKMTDDFTKPLAYIEHAMQLAAYRVGLGIPKATCYNLFISTSQPGLVKLHKWTDIEIKKAEQMFLYLVKYWKLLNNIED